MTNLFGIGVNIRRVIDFPMLSQFYFVSFVLLILLLISLLVCARRCSGSSSRSGREMEFLVASPQAQLAASGAGVERALPHTVTLLFTHVHNYSAVGE